jgi:hypothetical protein
MKDFTNATPEERTVALAALGLSLKSTFVPFSRSRNAKPGKDGKVWRSLNWKVTLSKGGRELLTTDYGQGEANCPAYHHPPKFENGKPDQYHQRLAIADEIENGKTAFVTRYGQLTRRGTIPGPTLLEVCYSLAMNAQSGQERFPDFCANFGYDEDSRKAEETWRACADTYRALGADLTEKVSRIVEGY